GVLVRVSSDPNAMIVRTSLGSSDLPDLSIGGNARISGGSVTLDSTNVTTLNPTARLDGRVVNLNSGRISIQLKDSGSLPADAGLILAGTALRALQRASLGFSLLSYTSIDIYGHGQVGSFNSSGTPEVASLALHAGAIRGFNSGPGVVFAARDITLDNSAAATGSTSIAAPAGTLSFDAETIHLGQGSLEISQFANLVLN